MRTSFSPFHRVQLDDSPPLAFLRPAQRNGKPLPPKRRGGGAWLRRNSINILLALLALTVVLTAGLRLLTPRLSATLADSLPGGWIRASSEQVLGELENSALAASQLPLHELDYLRDSFAALKAAPEGAPPYRLLFRRSLNASHSLLTLPGGEIIVTDQFLQSVPDPLERLALLCHELGHLQHRHALRSAIENRLYWLAAAAFLGSSESSIRALTEGMEQATLKRRHVLEADLYAVSMLRANGLSPRLLLDAIEHGQGPLSPAQLKSDPLAHHQHFDARVRALQNLL